MNTHAAAKWAALQFSLLLFPIPWNFCCPFKGANMGWRPVSTHGFPSMLTTQQAIHKHTWQPLQSFKAHIQLCQLTQGGTANKLRCVKGRTGAHHCTESPGYRLVASNREAGPVQLQLCPPNSHVEEKWHGWISQHLFISSPFFFFCPLSLWWTDADWH